MTETDNKSRDVDTFALYVQDLKTRSLLSREDEQRLACEIRKSRVEVWEALIGCASLHLAICDALQRLGEPAEGIIERLRQGSLAELGGALAALDPDDVVADRLCAQLVPEEPAACAVRRAQRERIAAEQAFATGNLRLVIAIARRFTHALPLQDAIQEGNLGLMKAIKRFDPARGFRFSTYGGWWIKNGIQRGVGNKARVVRLPVHMVDAGHKLGQAERRFRTEEGRSPTDEELATATSMSLKRVQRVRAHTGPVTSLDAPVEPERGELKTMRDVLRDESASGDERVAASQEERLLLEAMAVLTPTEQRILALRTGMQEHGGEEQELTLKQVGERMHVCRERVRQLQEVALAKLRDEFRRRGVKVR